MRLSGAFESDPTIVHGLPLVNSRWIDFSIYFLTLLCYALRMDEKIVNVKLRGDDVALLDKLKASLAIKGDSATDSAAVRYALRVAARKSA
jgi:hypothetical protein